MIHKQTVLQFTVFPSVQTTTRASGEKKFRLRSFSISTSLFMGKGGLFIFSGVFVERGPAP
ncbi:unnamed protein product, partial [Allacma fusca]